LRKLALKRLTASDLTFFEWHFRNHNAGNQKAINLNADVFISGLYPSLPEVALASSGRLPIDLYLYGPGLSQELNFQRKIIKFGSYKNWRLDGEFIYDPPINPERFHTLVAGDIVVFEFGGDVTPSTLKAFFFSRSLNEDRHLHGNFNEYLGQRAMASITEVELEALVRRAAPSDRHPINELLIEADLEDAAQGGEAGLEKLYSRRSGARLSKAELAKAIKHLQEVGQMGEEFVQAYLDGLKTQGAIRDYHWVSQDNAVSPFDFWVEDEKSKGLLDVKATRGQFERYVHVSVPELESMFNEKSLYVIYRVYEMSDNSAKLRVSGSMKEFAGIILDVLRKLPPGVQSDGISIDPSTIQFGLEIPLLLAADAVQPA
jgi:hypothetical protein